MLKADPTQLVYFTSVYSASVLAKFVRCTMFVIMLLLHDSYDLRLFVNCISQWWPKYGPRANSSLPSFNIWLAKVFYIAALICITVIFCIYVKKNLECIFLWPAIKKKLFFMARGKKSLATLVYPLLVIANAPTQLVCN
jgi:hypothetical protein